MTATDGGTFGDGGNTSTQYLKEGYLSYMAPSAKDCRSISASSSLRRAQK